MKEKVSLPSDSLDLDLRLGVSSDHLGEIGLFPALARFNPKK